MRITKIFYWDLIIDGRYSLDAEAFSAKASTTVKGIAF
jgi:hypothetical protein